MLSPVRGIRGVGERVRAEQVAGVRTWVVYSMIERDRQPFSIQISGRDTISWSSLFSGKAGGKPLAAHFERRETSGENAILTHAKTQSRRSRSMPHIPQVLLVSENFPPAIGGSA